MWKSHPEKNFFGKTRPSSIKIIGFTLLAIGLLSCGPISLLISEQPEATSTLSIPATATPMPAVDTPEATVEAVDSTATTSDSIVVDAEPKPEPELDEVTFALGITEDNEPVDANLLFTQGITKVHAIFDYQGMLPGSTWERVWYFNDREVARSTSEWTGPESGTFDYFIDNGGKPLPPGDWILEIYVEGKLKLLGVFIIEAAPEESQNSAGTVDNGVYLLAYTKCDGDYHNVYVADTNGQNEQLLVTRAAGPSWSPSGGLMFFVGQEGVDRQVRDGQEVVFEGISNGLVAMSTDPLPTHPNQFDFIQYVPWKQGLARWTRVSPNGGMVAYDANPGGDYRVYFLGTAANQQYRFELVGEQADWSPDSEKVVYRSGRNGEVGIWISNRDDTGHTRITTGGSDAFPAWSLDGSTIAFAREEGGNVDIYAMNVDGSNVRRLTNSPGHDTLPTFAPNGDIIFRSTRTGQWSIWKMKGDGSGQVEIIADACVGNDWAYSTMDVFP